MRLTRVPFSKTFSIVLGLACAGATGNVSYADFRPGRDAYLRGEYSQAFELFLPSALQGSTKSRIGLGLLLARGDGLKADYIRSYSWFDMAVAQGQGEHIVVQILARVNRDYLAKHMTPAEIETAKLRSAMTLAVPETMETTGRSRLALAHMLPMPVKASARLVPAGSGSNVAIAETEPSERYSIQLAALRKGHATDLLLAWSRLAKRHHFLTELEPTLVRVDLKDLGVYDSLRAGPFATSSGALSACAALAEVKQDCLVVLK